MLAKIVLIVFQEYFKTSLFILSILVFLSVRFIPGDVIDVLQGRLQYSESGVLDREALERRLGLDVPAYVQYARWIGDILLHGSLGESLLTSYTVEEAIFDRLPVTLELGVLAIVIGLVIALPVGIYSAIRQDTAADYLGRSLAIIGLATPNFWLGIMVMIYPTIWWGWTPPLELVHFTEDPLGNLWGFFIPSLILGTASAAATMRMTRTMMLEVLKSGLYPHRLVQGAQGAGRGDPAQHQKCPHSGDNPNRPAVADPGGRRGDYGEHLQPAGDRASLGECPQ